MQTRIKYSKVNDTIYISNFFFGRNKMYMASFNTEFMEGLVMLKDPSTMSTIESYRLGPFKSVKSIKKAIKQKLASLGIMFYSEVRNKSKHKKLIKEIEKTRE